MADLEFAVDDYQGQEKIFPTFEAACAFAVAKAVSRSEDVDIDVLCWTREAAVSWGCEESYDEDPEASVSDRITITANHVGRVA